MNEPIKEAFDMLFSDMCLSEHDAAFKVFALGWKIGAIHERRSAIDHEVFFCQSEFICSTGLCHYKPWAQLTDEEIVNIANDCRWSETYHSKFARAIEAKLKEKNR